MPAGAQVAAADLEQPMAPLETMVAQEAKLFAPHCLPSVFALGPDGSGGAAPLHIVGHDGSVEIGMAGSVAA